LNNRKHSGDAAGDKKGSENGEWGTKKPRLETGQRE